MNNLQDNQIRITGRLVEGDCFEGRTTDQTGAPLVIKTGANAGQPRTDYYIGVAVSKSDPEWPATYARLVEIARDGFPTLFDTAGNCTRADFAWKLIDGDSTVMNQNNKRPCDKEGFPGHWVVRMSTGISPKCYNEQVEQVTEAGQIKRGFYICVLGSVKANDNAQKPGIYINHSLIQRVGYGPEIVGGPDAKAVFSAGAALPVGASAAPLAPTTPAAAPGALPPGTAPAGYAETSAHPHGPGATPPAAATPPVQPDPNILNAPGAAAPGTPPAATPPAATPPAPAAPPTPTPPTMTALAQGFTYSQMLEAGWTHEGLLAGGYIADVPY